MPRNLVYGYLNSQVGEQNTVGPIIRLEANLTFPTNAVSLVEVKVLGGWREKLILYILERTQNKETSQASSKSMDACRQQTIDQ